MAGITGARISQDMQRAREEREAAARGAVMASETEEDKGDNLPIPLVKRKRQDIHNILSGTDKAEGKPN